MKKGLFVSILYVEIYLKFLTIVKLNQHQTCPPEYNVNVKSVVCFLIKTALQAVVVNREVREVEIAVKPVL